VELEYLVSFLLSLWIFERTTLHELPLSFLQRKSLVNADILRCLNHTNIQTIPVRPVLQLYRFSVLITV
jgi:hypothetical protein